MYFLFCEYKRYFETYEMSTTDF